MYLHVLGSIVFCIHIIYEYIYHEMHKIYSIIIIIIIIIIFVGFSSLKTDTYSDKPNMGSFHEKLPYTIWT